MEVSFMLDNCCGNIAEYFKIWERWFNFILNFKISFHQNQSSLTGVSKLRMIFFSGINAGISPMYLTEICPTNLRGAVSNNTFHCKGSFINDVTQPQICVTFSMNSPLNTFLKLFSRRWYFCTLILHIESPLN